VTSPRASRSLPAASIVFADDDGDGAVEIRFELIEQKRQTERIGCSVDDPLGSS
jgi:hypothetical protein